MAAGQTNRSCRRRCHAIAAFAATTVLLFAGLAGETAAPSAAAAESSADPLTPFLARHCLECHGPAKAKADLRLDQLSRDFSNHVTRDRWTTVLKRVKAGEMP